LTFQSIERLLPRSLHRYILHFEAAIEDAVAAFAASLPAGARILDAGAGESVHAKWFAQQRYVAVDLAVGDAQWNYGKLDVIADLTSLPFRQDCFDAAINIVTLEHVREPRRALTEISRALTPGARVLLIVPHEWEVHQSPHDYFRYTRHGMAYLLEHADFTDIRIAPVGGYFRLLSRRLFNGLQFFRGLWFVPAAIVLTPPALMLPLFDRLDRDRNFTLGYIVRPERHSRRDAHLPDLNRRHDGEGLFRTDRLGRECEQQN
jgi:SAM-dependent methyltransferase